MVGLALAQGCFSGNELEHGLPSTKTNLYVIDLPSYNVVTTFLESPTISSDSAIKPKKIKWYWSVEHFFPPLCTDLPNSGNPYVFIVGFQSLLVFHQKYNLAQKWNRQDLCFVNPDQHKLRTIIWILKRNVCTNTAGLHILFNSILLLLIAWTLARKMRWQMNTDFHWHLLHTAAAIPSGDRPHFMTI